MRVPIGPEGVATVQLDGSGNGTTKVFPLSARERWHPDVASVSASTAVAEAQCKIFVGDAPISASYIDGTRSGSTGDSTGHVKGTIVRTGQAVWAQWTGGDAGAIATLKVTGSKDLS